MLELDRRDGGIYLRCSDCGEEHSLKMQQPYVLQVTGFADMHRCPSRRVIQLPD